MRITAPAPRCGSGWWRYEVVMIGHLRGLLPPPQAQRSCARRGRGGDIGASLSSFVPRTQRSAPPLRRGALQSRGPSCKVGPGSAAQREERCTASGTRVLNLAPMLYRSAPPLRGGSGWGVAPGNNLVRSRGSVRAKISGCAKVAAHVSSAAPMPHPHPRPLPARGRERSGAASRGHDRQAEGPDRFLRRGLCDP